MSLSISKASLDEVQGFWQTSPYATVFSHPSVLQTLSHTVDWWICKNGENPLCCWPVCLDVAGSVYLPGGSYYVGPLWGGADVSVPEHRRASTYLNVYEAYISHLLPIYGALKASLPLGIDDVRAFSWWNYGSSDQAKFTITPRYTACIAGIDSVAFDQIAAGFRQVRRYEIKQVGKKPLPERVTDWTAEELFDLYSGIYEGKTEGPSKSARETMQKMVALVQAGFGEVLAYRLGNSGTLAYAALLLYGNQVANLVYSMVSGEHRHSGLVAWGIKAAIQAAQAQGCKVFDFNGANSPQRGDDKHSYGAAAKLYFEIEIAEKTADET